MLVVALICLITGLAVGFGTGVIFARHIVRKRRAAARAARKATAAAKPAAEPVPFALTPREPGLTPADTAILGAGQTDVQPNTQIPTMTTRSSPFFTPPEPLTDWPGLTLGQESGYGAGLTEPRPKTEMFTMTGDSSPIFAAPPTPEHREPPRSAFERVVLEKQPLPDADVRGVARVPGPVEPALRAARVLRENSGEHHHVPGEQTDWLGRHHRAFQEDRSVQEGSAGE
jgi:hypothetical protein